MEIQLKQNGSYYMVLQTENQTYNKGDEVLISYGRKPNWGLLKSYGFILPNNKHDYIKISIQQYIQSDTIAETDRKNDLIRLIFKVDSPNKFSVKLFNHRFNYRKNITI